MLTLTMSDFVGAQGFCEAVHGRHTGNEKYDTVKRNTTHEEDSLCHCSNQCVADTASVPHFTQSQLGVCVGSGYSRVQRVCWLMMS